jgi:hypothetical protein
MLTQSGDCLAYENPFRPYASAATQIGFGDHKSIAGDREMARLVGIKKPGMLAL